MSDRSPSWTLPLISPAAPGALYEQIIEGIQREISAGRLRPGDALPSFRQLAADLMVSVITVKRAYEELERGGILYRRQGLGTFVSETGQAEASQLFQAAIASARQAGLSDREIVSLVRESLANLSNQPNP